MRLIPNQDCARPRGGLAHQRQKAGAGQHHTAIGHHRFCQHTGDIAPVKGGLQRATIIKFNGDGVLAHIPDLANQAASGFGILDLSTWDKSREFEEWMGIANDGLRTQSLREVARALAEEGRSAGMGMAIKDGKTVFFHRWRLIAAIRR